MDIDEVKVLHNRRNLGMLGRLDEICKPESSHDMRFKTMLQKNEEAEHENTRKRNLRCDRTYEHVLNIVII